MTPARELAPGIFWLPACQEHAYMGSLLHSCNSVYLVFGTACSLLVEAGHPRDLDAIEEELSVLLRAAPELRYVFTTHIQTGSASGAERWLRRWPRAELCGDVHDLHLVFPRLEHRLRPLEVGESLDLGGRSSSPSRRSSATTRPPCGGTTGYGACCSPGRASPTTTGTSSSTAGSWRRRRWPSTCPT